MLDNTAAPIAKPRRRKFQFGLRTLLVVAVLVGSACGYVAHEQLIVQERKDFSKMHVIAICEVNETYQSSHPEKSPSALRRWLGDTDYAWIFVDSMDDFPVARIVYPEAKIIAGGVDTDEIQPTK